MADRAPRTAAPLRGPAWPTEVEQSSRVLAASERELLSVRTNWLTCRAGRAPTSSVAVGRACGPLAGSDQRTDAASLRRWTFSRSANGSRTSLNNVKERPQVSARDGSDALRMPVRSTADGGPSTRPSSSEGGRAFHRRSRSLKGPGFERLRQFGEDQARARRRAGRARRRRRQRPDERIERLLGSSWSVAGARATRQRSRRQVRLRRLVYLLGVGASRRPCGACPDRLEVRRNRPIDVDPRVRIGAAQRPRDRAPRSRVERRPRPGVSPPGRWARPSDAVQRASGSSNENVEPRPGSDSTRIRPPIRRTSSREM